MWIKDTVHVDVIFLDFQKAFDKVPKTRLLQKRSAYGIEGKVLCWIADFLSDRKMRIMVRCEYQYSEWVDVNQRGSTRVCIGTYSVFNLCKRNPRNSKL